jgi:hypothetical protein
VPRKVRDRKGKEKEGKEKERERSARKGRCGERLKKLICKQWERSRKEGKV